MPDKFDRFQYEAMIAKQLGLKRDFLMDGDICKDHLKKQLSKYGFYCLICGATDDEPRVYHYSWGSGEKPSWITIKEHEDIGQGQMEDGR